MLDRRWSAALTLLCLAGVAVGCDSTVSSPGTGGQGGAGGTGPGAGGNGASGGNSTATTASGTPSSSSGNVDPPSSCQAACDHLDALGCGEGGPGCAEDCQGAYDQLPRCAGAFDAVVQCVATQSTCDVEDNCAPQVEAWTACVNANGCGPAECRAGGSSGGRESCSCSGVCEDQTVDVDCSVAAGESAATCQCSVNGMIVAECSEPTSTSCDLDMGCCAQYF